jgi:hypothetical protein
VEDAIETVLSKLASVKTRVPAWTPPAAQVGSNAQSTVAGERRRPNPKEVADGGGANYRKGGTLQAARRIVQTPPLMSTRWNPQRDNSLKVSKSLASTVAQASGAASRIR